MELDKMFDYGEETDIRTREGNKEYREDDNSIAVYLHDDDGRIEAEIFKVKGSDAIVETHRIFVNESTYVEVNLGGMMNELVIKKDGIVVMRQDISRNRAIMQDFAKKHKGKASE